MVLADGCIAAPPHTGLPVVQDIRIEARPRWSTCLPLFSFNGPVLIDAVMSLAGLAIARCVSREMLHGEDRDPSPGR
jgi:hypothetical protein